MGREHAIDHEPPLPGYVRLEGDSGAVVWCASALSRLGQEVLGHLEAGLVVLPDSLGVPAPDFEALVVAGKDWEEAPRDGARPYPPGLPYFTRAAEPPAIVIPSELSRAIQPRTPATLPLVVHHESAHAFLAGEVAASAPAWLRELPPQAASAVVARREGLPLDEHLAEIESPDFTIRGFRTPAGAREQMAFQNLLLKLGAAALEEFGKGFLRRLIGVLRQEQAVDETRAEEILAGVLGNGGREWLSSRPEFGE